MEGLPEVKTKEFQGAVQAYEAVAADFAALGGGGGGRSSGL